MDEALLLQAQAGQGDEVLRIWEWPSLAVVLGSGCRLAEDVMEETCQADAVPILRRSSGGGTVLLGHGCLLYSLVLRYDRAVALGEIPSSYRFILEHVGAALRTRGHRSSRRESATWSLADANSRVMPSSASGRICYITARSSTIST